ncbi:MAG: DUF3047 domain-containing protein [Rhodospirillales bacterium]|nr:DUF3047 domain-containing protein [Rhodospirillales bacterium]
MTRLRRRLAPPFPACFVAGLFAFALSACSLPEATIQLGSSLSILPAHSSFAVDELPDDWFTHGTIPADKVSASASLGSSSLSVSSAHTPFLVARRVRANLHATPYLSWRWRVEPGKWQYHPVRLVVGFSGGGGTPADPSVFARLFPGSAIPAYDRVISFVWAPSALMRGTLVQLPSQPELREAQYMVRGGMENVGRWWPETVDLAALYRRSWPDDRINATRIAFIGVSAAPSTPAFQAYLADLQLSR